MCGRFTILYTWREISRILGAVVPAQELEPRYNLAPTQDAPILRKKPQNFELEANFSRWGLIPFWAKEKQISATLANARVETVASKPSFRKAFKSQRCIVPISGFYEWQKLETAKTKQAFYIFDKNNIPLFIAGLWDTWLDEEENKSILSFSLVTRAANSQLSQIHSRMPLILRPEDITSWLDKDSNALLESEFMQCKPEQPEGIELVLKPVGNYVNNARNQGPKCLE